MKASNQNQVESYTVIAPYESSNPDPITFQAGDLIKVGQKFVEDPEWTNWVKCENAEGKTGWTPLQVLRVDGDWATTLVDYTAHELTVCIGEQLLVERVLNGWAWAKTHENEWGWVPIRNIEKSTP